MFGVIDKVYKLIDYLKVIFIKEQQLEARAKSILESAKKIEGFIGGGYTEEQIIKRIKEELASNKTALIIYSLFNIAVVFPIYLLLVHFNLGSAILGTLVSIGLSYGFYCIFTLMGILSALRLK